MAYFDEQVPVKRDFGKLGSPDLFDFLPLRAENTPADKPQGVHFGGQISARKVSAGLRSGPRNRYFEPFWHFC